MATDAVPSNVSRLSTDQSGRDRLLTFDWLRILAMAAIAYQHLWPMYDLRVNVGDFPNVGQVGVTIFCGLSGYFSFRHLDQNLWIWIRDRLARIVPEYWVALSGVFVLNAAAGYKSTSLRTIVLQYAGMAAFLNEEQRIGQPYWFITLLLGCYGLAVLIRAWPPMLPVAIALAAWMLRPGHWFAPHFLSFLLCGSMAFIRKPLLPWLMAAGLAALSAVTHSAWLYPLTAVLSVSVCRLGSWPSPSWLNSLSQGTYEFFLVHGPVYLALANIAHLSLPANILAGTLLAGVAGYVVYCLTQGLQRCAWDMIGRARGASV